MLSVMSVSPASVPERDAALVRKFQHSLGVKRKPLAILQSGTSYVLLGLEMRMCLQ